MIVHYFLIAIIAQGSWALNLRIINGDIAAPHQFPHHVAIFYKALPLTPEILYCGGSIITPEWTLTAGHCVPKFGSIIVKAGKHYININESYQQNRHVIKRIIHDNYVGPIVSKKLIARNDIALLKLQSPLVYSNYIQPIALPSIDNPNRGFGKFCGFGSISGSLIPKFPNELRSVELEIIDNNSCTELINSAFLENQILDIEINDGQVCTNYNTQDGGPCYVDNGSAFIQYNDTNTDNKKAEAIGLFSWTQLPCGKFNMPAVYTRVSAYVDWIEKNIASA